MLLSVVASPERSPTARRKELTAFIAVYIRNHIRQTQQPSASRRSSRNGDNRRLDRSMLLCHRLGLTPGLLPDAVATPWAPKSINRQILMERHHTAAIIDGAVFCDMWAQAFS